MKIRIMSEAERLLTERGCPKLNLLVPTSNAAVLAFYRELGYVRMGHGHANALVAYHLTSK